jgi:hypothetical protein
MPALVMNCAVIGESHSPNSHTALPAAVIFNPCVEVKGRPSFLPSIVCVDRLLSGAEREDAHSHGPLFVEGEFYANSFVLGPAVINTHSFALFSPACICVGVVECAHPYTYLLRSCSNKHTLTPPPPFPDERTPIEATPLSATSAELVLGLGQGLGLDSLSQSGFGIVFTLLLVQ